MTPNPTSSEQRQLEIRTFVVPLAGANCYLVRAGSRAVLVDCGGVTPPLREALRGQELEAILLTHAHADHIAGIDAVRALASASPPQIWIAEAEAAWLGDPRLNTSAGWGVGDISVAPADHHYPLAGGEIEVAGLQWRVLDTSGHSPGGISLHLPRAGVVFTGDALFRASIGRTDLPGGDLDRLLAGIRSNLLALPPQTVVLPGHGLPTTIGEEAASNPFL